MKKTIGIIGGLGPQTGCDFCLSLNRRFIQRTQCQPHILLDNLAVSEEAEQKLIQGALTDEHLLLLKDSVAIFNKLSVDVIAIACNTVHVFIDELRRLSKIPILSITEETAKVCVAKELLTVGLLASTLTVNMKLHAKELAKKHIECLLPSSADQTFISECIIRIIHNRATHEDKARLCTIMKSLQNAGAQAIILGCTDLPILLSSKDIDIPVINTIQVLEDSVLESIL